MLNGLDLFSGIGGLTLALSEWVRPIAYCENDRYAQAVLLSRMSTKHLPKAPIWDDVRTLSGNDLPPLDIIYGGFPCQDISVAGRKVGLGGERSKLFFEIIRLAKETLAPFVFLENVPGIRTRGLNEVVRTLTDLGYDCRWTVVSAGEVGAPHLRKRWFLLAHSNSQRSKQRRSESKVWERQSDIVRTNWESNEPSIPRVVHGLPFRVDRVRGLGNSVVPPQARKAFKILIGDSV